MCDIIFKMKTIRFHRAVEKELKRWPDDLRQELADLLSLVASGQLLSMPFSMRLRRRRKKHLRVKLKQHSPD